MNTDLKLYHEKYLQTTNIEKNPLNTQFQNINDNIFKNGTFENIQAQKETNQRINNQGQEQMKKNSLKQEEGLNSNQQDLKQFHEYISYSNDDSDDEDSEEEYSIWEESEIENNGINADTLTDPRGNQLQFYQIYRLRSALYQKSYVSRLDTIKEVLKISSHQKKKISINTLKQQQNYLDFFYPIQKKDFKNEENILFNINKSTPKQFENYFNQVNKEIKDKNLIEQVNNYQNKDKNQTSEIRSQLCLQDQNSRRQSLKLLLDKNSKMKQIFENNKIYNTKSKDIGEQVLGYYARKQSLKLILNKNKVSKQSISENNNFQKIDLNKDNNIKETNYHGIQNKQIACEEEKQSPQDLDEKNQLESKIRKGNLIQINFSFLSNLKMKLFS
ncbi:hypothetical protein TTHERM_00643460 (macronuclear) [Tetrahymena thermophila SB210]|uniref:Uncharacterized protein n=1 Tax=Tetrahymena thermophila (strain SB210) TaxID=312017 RepID=Q23EY5_TETTS|nr:hypothetical protein TTHERM_00643460 [Tetrahymena thermophila SB210]EAR95120.2 hypothetical protein TTHERM_00643460 [Tetrahymena thermophila SB210]|eukprot:XP_001015365.2 hypothetical protein TTHERM_00643460 [Tetrahymena thermophila SB210]